MKNKGSIQKVQSILLLAGSFTFAFLLGETVHEFGHYLGHLACGNPDNAQVHLDPFGGSRIVGVSSIPDEIMAVTSASGPHLNLFLGAGCLVLLWRSLKPVLLPFLLWGPVALIQEGVTFSFGLLTPGGDAEWIVALGIPRCVILIFGIAFLVTGLGLVSYLLPAAGIKRCDAFKDRLFILLAGMCPLMLMRCVHSFMFTPAQILEDLIPLMLSFILVICITSVHELISKVIVLPGSVPVSRKALILALILGSTVFVFQLVGVS